jgi:hypothetical protein
MLNTILRIGELDLTEAGPVAIIPAERAGNGTYTIGTYIRKGETEALQYTDKVSTKIKEIIEFK